MRICKWTNTAIGVVDLFISRFAAFSSNFVEIKSRDKTPLSASLFISTCLFFKLVGRLNKPENPTKTRMSMDLDV